jgi:hypothetical protein
MPWSLGLASTTAMSVLPFECGRKVRELPSGPAELDQIDWTAVESTDFRSATLKEAKQAELLVHGSFRRDLVEAVGVIADGVRGKPRLPSLLRPTSRPSSSGRSQIPVLHSLEACYAIPNLGPKTTRSRDPPAGQQET